MSMTRMGQLLMEDGMEKGEFKTLQELIADGVLTAAEAADRKKMTVAEFQKKLGELRLI